MKYLIPAKALKSSSVGSLTSYISCIVACPYDESYSLNDRNNSCLIQICFIGCKSSDDLLGDPCRKCTITR